MPDELNAEVRAAGGIVWRFRDESQVEIAVVHRPRYDDWSFPKGKLDAGETDFEGALREVFEETGYRVRPGRALGEVRYLTQNGAQRQKVVRYWAMQATSGTFAPNREVDELRWLTLENAAESLTRDSDREVLERFRSGPISTKTMLLVRHGSAGHRSQWEGDDRLRPLDDTGRQQARELVHLLFHFDVQRLISADYVRCVQTLEPLSEAVGLVIDEEPLVSEQGFPGHEAEAVEAIRALGRNGESIVACSQRLVMPELLSRLAAEDDVELPHLRAKKGSVWVLIFDDRRLCEADYFYPPRLDP